MKNPHPSGKPIKREKYVRKSQWNCPREMYAVPSLRTTVNHSPVADAIGYKTASKTSSEWDGVTWTGKVGFVLFEG